MGIQRIKGCTLQPIYISNNILHPTGTGGQITHGKQQHYSISHSMVVWDTQRAWLIVSGDAQDTFHRWAITDPLEA